MERIMRLDSKYFTLNWNTLQKKLTYNASQSDFLLCCMQLWKYCQNEWGWKKEINKNFCRNVDRREAQFLIDKLLLCVQDLRWNKKVMQLFNFSRGGMGADALRPRLGQEHSFCCICWQKLLWVHTHTKGMSRHLISTNSKYTQLLADFVCGRALRKFDDQKWSEQAKMEKAKRVKFHCLLLVVRLFAAYWYYWGESPVWQSLTDPISLFTMDWTIVCMYGWQDSVTKCKKSFLQTPSLKAWGEEKRNRTWAAHSLKNACQGQAGEHDSNPISYASIKASYNLFSR